MIRKLKSFFIPFLCVLALDLSAQVLESPNYHWNQLPSLVNPAYVGIGEVPWAYSVFNYLQPEDTYYGFTLFGEFPLSVDGLALGGGYNLRISPNYLRVHQVNFATSYRYRLNDNHAFTAGAFLALYSQSTTSRVVSQDGSDFDIDLGVIYAFKSYAELGFAYSNIIDGFSNEPVYGRPSYITLTARGTIELNDFTIRPYAMMRRTNTSEWGWDIGAQAIYADKFRLGAGTIQGDDFYLTAGTLVDDFLTVGYGLGFRADENLTHEVILSLPLGKSIAQKRQEESDLEEEELQRYFDSQSEAQEKEFSESLVDKVQNSKIENLEERVKALEDSLKVYGQALNNFQAYSSQIVEENRIKPTVEKNRSTAYIIAGGFSSVEAAKKWQVILLNRYNLYSERIHANGRVYTHIFKSQDIALVRKHLLELPQKNELEKALKSNLWVYVSEK